VFRDRVEAGRRLAAVVAQLDLDEIGERNGEARPTREPIVLGLPRGGVPVAAEVARALGTPLDVLVVRKIGVPTHPELAMGAIGEGDVRIVDDRLVSQIGSDKFEQVERVERRQLEERIRRFRGSEHVLDLRDRTVVVVDDGVATGSSARAACEVVRASGAAAVVLAVPVAPYDWTDRMGDAADRYVSVDTPFDFNAVGAFYADFTQVSDDDVTRILAQRDPDTHRFGRNHRPTSKPHDEAVSIPVDSQSVEADLVIPADPVGVVVFAHGSGSSRHSPRNRSVAAALQRAGIATLLLDLLTMEEERHRANVFDVELLGSRLLVAIDWLADRPGLEHLPVGIFGASTGAAAALHAAAASDREVVAVVSRGGRPDLAGSALPKVTTPTLLIVGGRDEVVLDLNEQARARLGGPSRLDVVRGATHLFQEPGALEQVAELAADWFVEHFESTNAATSTTDA